MKQKGFTLVELLVVIAIIALLMAILMPALKSAGDQIKDTHCFNEMKLLSLTGIIYTDDMDRTLATITPVHDVEYKRQGEDTIFGLRFSLGFIVALGLLLCTIVIILRSDRIDFNALKRWLKSIFPRLPRGSL